MKVNKLISTGIGEITNPSSNEARYILKNHISAYKLKRSEITDIYEKLADERRIQTNNSILKTAQDMYNSVMNLL